MDKLSDNQLAALEAQVKLNIQIGLDELRGVKPMSVAMALIELKEYRNKDTSVWPVTKPESNDFTSFIQEGDTCALYREGITVKWKDDNGGCGFPSLGVQCKMRGDSVICEPNAPRPAGNTPVFPDPMLP